MRTDGNDDGVCGGDDNDDLGTWLMLMMMMLMAVGNDNDEYLLQCCTVHTH